MRGRHFKTHLLLAKLYNTDRFVPMDDAKRLSRLVSVLTAKGAGVLDPVLLKELKQHARTGGDTVLQIVLDALFEVLDGQCSSRRCLALSVIAELFARSACFRGLVVSRLYAFLPACGLGADGPLPPPRDAASALKAKAIDLISAWDHDFGDHYPELTVTRRWLVNVLRAIAPADAAQQSSDARRAARDAIADGAAAGRYAQLAGGGGLEAGIAEVDAAVSAIDQCLSLLHSSGCRPDDEWEDVPIPGSAPVPPLPPGAAPLDTTAAAAVRSMLEEHHRRAVGPLAVTARDWQMTLSRAGAARGDPRQGDRVTAAVAARDRLRAAATRAATALAATPAAAVVPVASALCDGASAAVVPALPAPLVALIPPPAPPDGWPVFDPDGGPRPGDGPSGDDVEREAKRRRAEHLSRAPVIPPGLDLAIWGSGHAEMASTRGLEIGNHWGAVDHDRVMTTPVTTVRRVAYTAPAAQPVPPCGAPLRGGGVCTRRDASLVCPLHGARQRLA